MEVGTGVDAGVDMQVGEVGARARPWSGGQSRERARALAGWVARSLPARERLYLQGAARPMRVGVCMVSGERLQLEVDRKGTVLDLKQAICTQLRRGGRALAGCHHGGAALTPMVQRLFLPWREAPLENATLLRGGGVTDGCDVFLAVYASMLTAFEGDVESTTGRVQSTEQGRAMWAEYERKLAAATAAPVSGGHR